MGRRTGTMRWRGLRQLICLPGRVANSSTWTLGCRRRWLSIWVTWFQSGRGSQSRNDICTKWRYSLGKVDWYGGRNRRGPMQVIRIEFQARSALKGLGFHEWYRTDWVRSRGKRLCEVTYKTRNRKPIVYTHQDFSKVSARQNTKYEKSLVRGAKVPLRAPCDSNSVPDWKNHLENVHTPPESLFLRYQSRPNPKADRYYWQNHHDNAERNDPRPTGWIWGIGHNSCYKQLENCNECGKWS